MAFKLSKKVNNAIYGYGAAIVIIGALMKITYFSPDWAPGIANTMLRISNRGVNICVFGNRPIFTKRRL